MAFKTETYYKKIEEADFKDGVLTIPEGYLEVSGTIFEKCDRKAYKRLKKVIFSSTIKTIKADCFKNRIFLETVVLNEGLETIDGGAFENCTELKDINFPSTLQNIGLEAFSMCESLISVKLPKNIQSVKASCFKSCHKLEIVDLGGLDSLSSYIFSDTPALNKIDVSKIKRVGQYSFAISGIKELVFKELETIHFTTFYKSNEIEHLEIPLNTIIKANMSANIDPFYIPEKIAEKLNMDSKIKVTDFPRFLAALYIHNDDSGKYDGAKDALDSGLFEFKIK